MALFLIEIIYFMFVIEESKHLNSSFVTFEVVYFRGILLAEGLRNVLVSLPCSPKVLVLPESFKIYLNPLNNKLNSCLEKGLSDKLMNLLRSCCCIHW